MSAADAKSQKGATLYVGDLHPNVTESLLFNAFAQVANVLNTRVCRDTNFRNSLGYGYINFTTYKDAENALSYMNNEEICGRPVRLMWSHRDPTLRKSGKGNMFVKNLEKSIIQKELFDTCEQFGTILSCKIVMDENGNSRGFGFVHFQDQDALEKAIKSLNGRTLRNRVLYAGHFIPKSERKSAGATDKFNNCYVKNFPTTYSDDDLNTLFKEFGEIKSAVVMKNEDGTSKGFGFVCFTDPTSAEKALQELSNREINEKQLYVSRAQRKDEREKELKQKYEKQRNERRSKYQPGVNLYVKNLDPTIDDVALHKAFSPYGEITSAKVMRDDDGVSKGFGFVCYSQSKEAANAITEMFSRKLGAKDIFVGIAERKDERKAKLTAEHQSGMSENRGFSMQPPMPYYPNTSFVPNQRYMQGAPMVARQRWNQPVIQTAMGNAANSTYIAPSQGGAQPSGYNVQPYQIRPKSGTPNVANVVNMQQNNMLPVSRPSAARQTAMQGVTQNAGMAQRMAMPTMPSHNVMARSTMPNVPNPNGVRYNQNARNVSAPMSQGPAVASVDNSDKQKNLLGERLYEYIKQMYPEQASKLTGVLLSMELDVLTALFDDRDALKKKVIEAEELLRKKEQGDPDANASANASKKGKK